MLSKYIFPIANVSASKTATSIVVKIHALAFNATSIQQNICAICPYKENICRDKNRG